MLIARRAGASGLARQPVLSPKGRRKAGAGQSRQPLGGYEYYRKEDD